MVPFISRRIALFVFSSLALAVFMIDHTTSWFDPVRSALNRMVEPLLDLAGIPRHAVDESKYWFESKDTLIQKISELESDQISRDITLQHFAKLKADNQALRDLLQLNNAQLKPFIAAQAVIQQISLGYHKIVVDKGAADGVVENAVIFDSKGILGQVHFVSEHHSWVTLISDPGHALPVIIGKQNIIGVLKGQGELDRLEISFIPESTAIFKGDRIRASGTGGRFPRGYPIAEVVEVEHDPDAAFARVQAKPLSNLTQIRFVLVMLPTDELQVNAEADIRRQLIKTPNGNTQFEEPTGGAN